MNCSPTICIALLLLSLSAGMFLLYKAQKENLNTFFKVVAWFIIVSSLCSMICCGLRCVMHGCMRGNECTEMNECGQGGFNKRVMIFRGGEGECEMGEGQHCCKEGKGECEEGEGECKEGEKACCKKDEKKCDMKMEMKMDSVTKKK